MLLEPRVLPDGWFVSERSIEHPSASLVPRPCEREIAIAAVHTRRCEIDRRDVEAHEHVDGGARPVAELIDLIVEREARWQRRRRRMHAIFDAQRHRLVPWVSVEVGADERAVLRPVVE